MSARDCRTSFLVGFAFPFSLAFVPLLFACGDGKFAFDAAVAEVEPNGDKRRALSLGGGGELFDLAMMQQQFSRAQALVIHGVAVREGADVGVQEEGLAVLEQAIGVLEVGLAFANGLDFGTAQGDATLVAVAEEVVKAGRAVEGGIACPEATGSRSFGLTVGLVAAVGLVGLESERGIGEGSMLAEQGGCNEAAGRTGYSQRCRSGATRAGVQG